ncbi:MAG: ABC transporter permease [Tannerellaceae bacterium]|jgi:ABC-2 type transport system permease protein|nr:ABC transporter permease [Tannerellaceae bacterium]
MNLFQKEFSHIFRDTRTMLILLGMPLVQIILFGFAITTEVNHIPLTIRDPFQQPLSRHLTAAFHANPHFTLCQSPTSSPLLILFDSPHKDATAIQFIADATDPNTAITQVAYASQLILQHTSTSNPQIIPNVRMLYNPHMKSAYNFVPGVIGLILMLICAMMTSISIVREKETGTIELLLLSPLTPLTIILSKALPYFLISCINLISILLLAVFVLQVPLNGSLPCLLLISAIYILVCLALGLLISTVASTQVAAMLISCVILMMPAMLLSGMIFPVENMPSVLQAVSCLIPARWYIPAVKKIMIQGLDFTYIWKEFLILLAMAALLLWLSWKKFRLRL